MIVDPSVKALVSNANTHQEASIRKRRFSRPLAQATQNWHEVVTLEALLGRGVWTPPQVDLATATSECLPHQPHSQAEPPLWHVFQEKKLPPGGELTTLGPSSHTCSGVGLTLCPQGCTSAQVWNLTRPGAHFPDKDALVALPDTPSWSHLLHRTQEQPPEGTRHRWAPPC